MLEDFLNQTKCFAFNWLIKTKSTENLSMVVILKTFNRDSIVLILNNTRKKIGVSWDQKCISIWCVYLNGLNNALNGVHFSWKTALIKIWNKIQFQKLWLMSQLINYIGSSINASRPTLLSLMSCHWNATNWQTYVLPFLWATASQWVNLYLGPDRSAFKLQLTLELIRCLSDLMRLLGLHLWNLDAILCLHQPSMLYKFCNACKAIARRRSYTKM